MPDKLKYIIIGLGSISLICIVIIFILLGNNASLKGDYDKLMEEKSLLVKKNDEAKKAARQLDDKVSSLSRDMDKAVAQLDRVSKDKAEIERKYEFVSREKEMLAEKVKSMASAPAAAVVEKKEAAPSFTPGAAESSYWAGVLKSKANLELQLENTREELKNIKIDYDRLQREKGTIDLETKNLSRQLEDAKRLIDYNQKLTDSLTQELVREKNDKFQIQSEIKTLKSENYAFRRQLDTLNSRKSALDEKLVVLQEKNKGLEDNLEKMETFVKEKMLQMDELSQQFSNKDEAAKEDYSSDKKESARDSVELPPIVVRPAQKEAGTSDVPQGGSRIVSVNRDNNFVIINQGELAGVKVGDTFQVYRDGRSIGSIEVIKARQNIAACDIKKESTPINTGDTIK